MSSPLVASNLIGPFKRIFIQSLLKRGESLLKRGEDVTGGSFLRGSPNILKGRPLNPSFKLYRGEMPVNCVGQIWSSLHFIIIAHSVEYA